MDNDPRQINNGADTASLSLPGFLKTLFNAVKESDKKRVDDVKEDIDTLLVFAGLFSAVVTSFIIASYPSLQPDNTDEIVFLLRQTLAQNYTFSEGVLRPMAPIPANLHFEAPLWALRVNGLWFASLIVSLSTASFGMLVKQWLIEYLNMEDWIVSEQQLRARHFRNPGLHRWKVFEIAALLPLFLHISLGLFFVGLSIYTAVANETIGRSTLVLVVGWAFFVLLTDVAPLASPRCPYKVASIKTTWRIGRRYITSHFWNPGRSFLNGAVYAFRWLRVNVISMPYRRARAFMDIFIRLRKGAKRVSVFLWLLLCAFSVPFQLLRGMVACLRYITSDHHTDTLEEDDMLQKPYQMHELFTIGDEALLDDGSTLETMAMFLRETHTPSPLITEFVLGCIRNRMGINSKRDALIPSVQGPIKGFLDLRILSQSGWNILATLVGDILRPEVLGDGIVTDAGNGYIEHNIWMANSVAVLLSYSVWPFPEHVHQLLTDDVILAKMWLLVRKAVAQWNLGDVLHMIQVTTTVTERKPGATIRRHERRWARLPTASSQERILTSLEVVVAQIILENSWRKHKGGSRYSGEAIQMLACILGTALPIMDVHEDESQLSQSTDGSDLEESTATDPDFPTEYLGVADYLAVIVGTSRELLESALTFYSAYFYRSLAPHRHEILWAGIHRTDSMGLLSADMKPLMLDLWRFLLSCARDEGGHGDHVQTDDFVKLCLVLARPNIPHDFGREDPAGDWMVLVPVLSRAADRYEDAASRVDASARDEGTVPALARHALDQLRLADFEAPDHLIKVLERLVGDTNRPSAMPGEQHMSKNTLSHGTRRLQSQSRHGSQGMAIGGSTPDPCVSAAHSDGSSHRASDYVENPYRGRDPTPLVSSSGRSEHARRPQMGREPPISIEHRSLSRSTIDHRAPLHDTPSMATNSSHQPSTAPPTRPDSQALARLLVVRVPPVQASVPAPERAPSTRTLTALPSAPPSRSGILASRAPSAGARHHASVEEHIPLAVMPVDAAQAGIRREPRSVSARIAPPSVHAPLPAGTGGGTRRRQGRSQSVDLEAGPADAHQPARPHRSRSTSQGPSAYSHKRPEH